MDVFGPWRGLYQQCQVLSLCVSPCSSSTSRKVLSRCMSKMSYMKKVAAELLKLYSYWDLRDILRRKRQYVAMTKIREHTMLRSYWPYFFLSQTRQAKDKNNIQVIGSLELDTVCYPWWRWQLRLAMEPRWRFITDCKKKRISIIINKKTAYHWIQGKFAIKHAVESAFLKKRGRFISYAVLFQ